ncbi:hypothetical protein KY290_004018 [Solanum tuberosum]|uniref:F-box family protein n=1 Tax=Solanum tuberosum TaxID=4113 RepID=A0ABQ7WUJ5_SOLTU|nr:hypothetical protein KY290_004018 [Solanum tuberosum]
MSTLHNAMITALYIPFHIGDQSFSTTQQFSAKIQHNTSTGGDKLKKRPSSGYLLSQDAYMNFRLVCKLWRSVAPPLRWKVVDHDQESMWLLSLNQKDGCEIRYAKDGWLLVSRGKSLFLLEPSGKQIIHLPQKTDDYFCDTMSFSASPTNSSAWDQNVLHFVVVTPQHDVQTLEGT